MELLVPPLLRLPLVEPLVLPLVVPEVVPVPVVVVVSSVPVVVPVPVVVLVLDLADGVAGIAGDTPGTAGVAGVAAFGLRVVVVNRECALADLPALLVEVVPVADPLMVPVPVVDVSVPLVVCANAEAPNASADEVSRMESFFMVGFL